MLRLRTALLLLGLADTATRAEFFGLKDSPAPNGALDLAILPVRHQRRRFQTSGIVR